MTGGDEPARKNLNSTATVAAAGARTRSEGATLVFATAAAVALGVACGIWINSLMASASSAGRVAQPRPEPTPAAEVRRVGHEDPPAASHEAEPSRGPAETAEAGALKLDPEEKRDEGHASERDEGAPARAARVVKSVAERGGASRRGARP